MPIDTATLEEIWPCVIRCGIRLLSTWARRDRPGGARTASQVLAAVSGFFMFLHLNRYRIIVIIPQRVLILDAGPDSLRTARGGRPSCRDRPGSARHRACGT